MYKVPLSKINYWIILTVSLVTVNLFGLHSFQTDGLFLSINTYDYIILLLNVWFFITFFSFSKMRHLVLSEPLKYLLYVYLFIMLIIFTMPFRGSISPVDAARVGREFLLIPLVFLVSYNVHHNGGEREKKLLFLFAGIASIQILLNTINPDIVKAIFTEIRAEQGAKFEYERDVVISNTMLFPHLLTLILFFSLTKNGYQHKTFLLFAVFFFASGLQGFRSYFLATCFIMLGYTIFQLKLKKLLAVTSIVTIVLFVDVTLMNEQIYGKFDTAVQEVTGAKKGTANNRFERDLLFNMPMFLQKPLTGWGFIYHDSEYGRKLNLAGSESGQQKTYGLYSIDSGYLSMLNMFGILGCLIILFLFIQVVNFLRKKITYYANGYIFAGIGFFFVLLFGLYTHGGFYSDFGLLPLMLVLGIGIQIQDQF